MQAVSRRCGSAVRSTVRQGLRERPFTACRVFTSGSVNKQDQGSTKNSDDIPPIPDEEYLQNVTINSEAKTVKTAVGDLPISPLMDPAFYKARMKYTKTKPAKPEHKLTKFQRHLRRNPYALALAEPVRRCPITETALPKFFLQSFNLMAHPETGEPWFVPTGLESKVPDAAAEPPPDAADGPDQSTPEAEAISPVPSESVATETDKDGAAQAAEPAGGSSHPPTKQNPNNKPRIGPSAYVLSYQPLFQEFERHERSPYKKGYKRLGWMSDHGHNKLGSVLNKAQWRADMDAILLELMRRRVVEGLAHFARLVEEEGREYVVRCEKWEDVFGLKHRGCLLYLGPAEEGQAEDYAPPRLSKMEIPGARYGKVIAVHNLRRVLGEEHLGRLREQSKLFREGSLFLLGRQATVKLQMVLWKLQGYIPEEKQQGRSPGADPSPEETGGS
ncbi:hypothetical protein VTJ83DRAFT_3344 [Remersonia thermophila]|uniref:Uncharacterized protein n=1 Tax=Remersonia thermophila TaxID=72144 RepID=A0ABR4DDR1_9PEZI